MVVKLFLILLVFVGCVDGAKFKVPIKRVPRRIINEDQWNSQINSGQFGKNKPTYSFDTEPLYEYSTEYLGDVHVGTPPQHFRLLFDTGSANTWITDNACECVSWLCKASLTCKAACEKHCCEKNAVNSTYHPMTQQAADVCVKKSKFDHKSSTTYVPNGKDWSQTYNKGSVSGILGSDTLSLGDLSIPGVTFGQAVTLDKVWADDPLDGVLGLAFRSISVDNVEPAINQAVDEDLLDDPIFTVWLKNENSQEKKLDGTITFGDIDGDNCGFIMAYEPLTAETFWQFNVAAVTIEQETFAIGYNAISVTGSSFIQLAKPLFDKVIAASKATFDKKYKFYKVDCDATFKLSFKIGDLDYPISANKVIYNTGKLGCQLLVAESTDSNIPISLGNPFNQEYCVIYDYSGQLGFAESF